MPERTSRLRQRLLQALERHQEQVEVLLDEKGPLIRGWFGTRSRLETFDAEAAGRAARQRVESASRLQDAVAGALGRIHALLTSEQRSRLAYLIRAGAIAL